MKLIVADDEKWVRATIINVIPFESLGLSLVSEASNGFEALDLCKKIQPDILITDIMMPGLTGLELIKELKQALPNLKVIIISGYNDFEYAKTAMQLGVQHFIVKPVDEVELENTLKKVIDLVNTENKRQSDESFYKSGYENSLLLVKGQFLNRIILPNSYTVDYIKKKFIQYKITFDNNNFYVAVLSPDQNSSRISETQKNNCLKLLGKVLKKYCNGITFLKEGEDLKLISIIKEKNDKAFLLLRLLFNKRFGGTLSIGLSLCAASLIALPTLFEQSNEALSCRFWTGSDKIYYYKNCLFESNTDLVIPQEIIEKLIMSIKVSDTESVSSQIESIAGIIKKSEYSHPKKIKEFIWSIIQLVSAKVGSSDYTLLGQPFESYKKIQDSLFLNEIMEYFKETIYGITLNYGFEKSVTHPNCIEAVKKILEENYYTDISLEIIAKKVHFSPAYISELFKKETGMSFIDYKTHLRIESAKELLKTTKMNITEISRKIGYYDPKYFSKLFKKTTGVPIQDFRGRQIKG